MPLYEASFQRVSSETCRINRSGVWTFGKNNQSLSEFSARRNKPKRSAAAD